MGKAKRLPSGRWQARYRDGDGKRYTRSFATSKAAEHWKADRESEVRRGEHYDASAGRMTLGAWAELWLPSRGVEASTSAADKSRLNRHILPTFKTIPLGRITRLRVQTWIREMERDGCGSASIHSCAYLLSAMLREAVREGLIRDNPAKDLDLPVLPPARDRVLSRSEVEAVSRTTSCLRSKSRPRTRSPGMRWGEVAGSSVSLTRRGISLS